MCQVSPGGRLPGHVGSVLAAGSATGETGEPVQPVAVRPSRGPGTRAGGNVTGLARAAGARRRSLCKISLYPPHLSADRAKSSTHQSVRQYWPGARCGFLGHSLPMFYHCLSAILCSHLPSIQLQTLLRQMGLRMRPVSLASGGRDRQYR